MLTQIFKRVSNASEFTLNKNRFFAVFLALLIVLIVALQQTHNTGSDPRVLAMAFRKLSLK